MWPSRFLRRETEELLFEAPWPEREDIQSFYAFALPKAGSSLLEAILFDLSAAAGIVNFTPTVRLFEIGVRDEEVELDTADSFLSPGFCFSGFRHVPPFLSAELLRQRKALLLVRDPRDMLVSMYFSMRYSHVEPGEGTYRDWFLAQRTAVSNLSIDRFAANVVRDLNAELEAMLGALRYANIRLYRYEDVIYRKRDWIADIVNFLELGIADSEIDAIAARHDRLPTAENQSEHIRQGHPGDGERKLSPQTLDRVGKALSQQWHWLGYPTAASDGQLARDEALVQSLLPPSPPAKIECSAASEDDIARAMAAPREIHPQMLSLKTGLGEILGAWMEARRDEKGSKRLIYSYVVKLAPIDQPLIFGCRISDPRDGLVFGRNSLALDHTPQSYPEGGYVRVTWDLPHPVPPGRYKFSAGCSYAHIQNKFIAREVETFAATLPLPAA